MDNDPSFLKCTEIVGDLEFLTVDSNIKRPAIFLLRKDTIVSVNFLNYK